MENKILFKNVWARLETLQNKNSFYAWRCAGALEIMLVQAGFLKVDEKFDLKTGGKKYFPVILDFTWTESYPEFILRKSREYLDFN